MDVIISVPILPPSLLAPQTLETIPGSASPTPPARSLRSTPKEEHIPIMISHPCEAGPSRYIPPLDSYFSLPPSSSRLESVSAILPIQPFPKGKGRALPTLASAFELGAPLEQGRVGREYEDVVEIQDSPESGGARWKYAGRRRAVTLSQTSPDLSPSPSSPSSPPRPERRADIQRRRASLGSAPFGLEPPNNLPLWSSKSHEDLGTTSTLPFAYPQPSYSSTPTIRSPGSPDITPRKSSLIDILGQSQSTLVLGGPIHMSPTFPLLGLSGVDTYSPPGSPIQFDIQELNEDMPHGPPPRRSSLSFGPDVIIDHKAISPVSSPRERPTSLLSASFSTTEESSAFFSPTSTDPHPLSSASTSLSRSAKSVKDGVEGDDAAQDAALTALKLQRSLEWEAIQGRHRRKLEKRRMILLELVETEVAYAEDLKALVEVYLPQLHALPAVPESSAMAVGRNAAELLGIHSGLSVRMVQILKDEGLGYEMVPEEDLAGKVERVSRKLASALVDQVSTFCELADSGIIFFCIQRILFRISISFHPCPTYIPTNRLYSI